MKTFKEYLLERKGQNLGNWGRNPQPDSPDYDSFPDETPEDESEGNREVNLSYGVYKVFQKYIEGQMDPLHDILQRRGDSVDFVKVRLDPEEFDRLEAVAYEIIEKTNNYAEKRTAELLLKSLRQF